MSVGSTALRTFYSTSLDPSIVFFFFFKGVLRLSLLSMQERAVKRQFELSDDHLYRHANWFGWAPSVLDSLCGCACLPHALRPCRDHTNPHPPPSLAFFFFFV